jgi:hypothetical protein
VSDTTDTVNDMLDPQSNDLQGADLTPDGDEWATDDDTDQEIDVSDLRVNFSKDEAEAETFDELPVGKYPTIITGCKVVRSTSAKNPGKPYYKLEFTVQPPNRYARAKAWGNVMLWEGALYSLSQLMKALGYDVEGNMRVPQPDDLIGQQVIIKMGMGKENKVEKNGETVTYPARVEVKGYLSYGGMKVTSGAARDELEP